MFNRHISKLDFQMSACYALRLGGASRMSDGDTAMMQTLASRQITLRLQPKIS